MAQSGNTAGTEAPVWRVGAPGVDELERLAGEIRPSWEVGLDAANDPGSSMTAQPAIVSSSQGFAAAPGAMFAELRGMMRVAAPLAAVGAAAPDPTFTERNTPAQTPGAASAISGERSKFVGVSGRSFDARAAVSPSTVPVAHAAPSRSKRVLLGGIAAGVAAIGVVAFLAMRGTGATASAATATSGQSTSGAALPAVSQLAVPGNVGDSVRETQPTPVAAAVAPVAPALAAPVPAAVLARQAPLVLVPRTAVLPAPAIVQPSPQTNRSPGRSTHPTGVVRAVVNTHTVAGATHPRPVSTPTHGPRPVRGVGFVSDSPY